MRIMKASAGSGKTYNLARRYIELLLGSDDRYAYRHILAVTFTNKATDEMKRRILKELHVMAVNPSESGYLDYFVPSVAATASDLQKKARGVLCDILHDYSAFAVSTIDRFFQQTLKAFSHEIGQFASYQVELDKDSLIAESVDRVLDSLTEEDEGLLGWLTDNVLEQIEQGDRYSMDANLMNMALRLRSVQRQSVIEKAGIDEDKAYSKERLLEIRCVCRKIMADFRSAVKVAARAALDVIESAGVNPGDSNRGFLEYLYDYDELDEIKPVTAPSGSFLAKASDHEKWFAKAKAKTFLPLVYPDLAGPLDEFCRLWGREYAVYNTACIIDDQIYGLGVAGELRRSFQELMKEKNVLCIDDSNTILRDIIDGSDAPFVYEKTGVRFDHFLLDEFQDTSDIQWINFSPLLHNSESQGGGNLVVGDVKQSIYRWRGSDWELLDRTVPGEFPGHEEVVLDTNYRSLPAVVEFNNAFFKSAASALDSSEGYECGCGPVSEIYSDVVQDIARKSSQRGSVSVSFCPPQNELQEVLNAVYQAVGRGARLNEVAVLVRSNLIGENVASYLIDNGIPVITDDSLKVKGSLTVRRLVSLMSYVANPEDTVNSYLAESLNMEMPDGCCSLTDMAEHIIREIKAADDDGIMQSEAIYLQSFMDHLQDYVSSNGNDLRGFLKHWEGEDPSISSPASGNSVRVMTIHKSKGLDFPYVIIPYIENITLFKPGKYWCSPDLAGTPLEGIAEGVYDVRLSSFSEASLFRENYVRESFLQLVDNINTIYVAMTRAASGMHLIARTPSLKFKSILESGASPVFSDFSQILYWFVSESGALPEIKVSSEGESEYFTLGEIVDFAPLRKDDASDVIPFEVEPGMEYPSFELAGKSGRLRLSADAAEFFSEEGDAGVSASRRIRGVILHDILSKVNVPSDLGRAVEEAVLNGEVTGEEAEQMNSLLGERLAEAVPLGWFPEGGSRILNEVELIDTDGRSYRPDRVVVADGKVIIVDYKSGEHHRKYEHQLIKYADIWHRMGYEDVSAYLWYLSTGEIIHVC